jgi:hypothetical protein
MPRHPGLVDPRPGYEVAHRLLALAQHFDNPPSRRIGKRLKGI